MKKYPNIRFWLFGFSMLLNGLLISMLVERNFYRDVRDFRGGYELGAWHTVSHHKVTGQYPPLGWRWEAWKNDNGWLELDDIMTIYYKAGFCEQGERMDFPKFSVVYVDGKFATGVNRNE